MVSVRHLLGVAAGLVATPVAAADMAVFQDSTYWSPQAVAGDAGVAVGYFSFDGDGTGEVWGAARLNIPVSAGWNEEIELSGLTGFETDSYYTYGLYSYTYWKDERFAAGLLSAGSNLSGASVWTLGAEGAVFLPSASLIGLVAYNWADNNGVPDFWSAGGEARWYLTPNTKLTGSVSFNEFNTAWKLTAGAEQRFTGTMVSLFGEGNYYTNSQGTGWEGFAGVRAFFDRPGQSLQRHDHDVPFASARAITF
jgi:hypothetical protein